MGSVLHSAEGEWEWHRPLLGPSYWTCSFQSVLVVSDLLAPLSEIQTRYPSAVQRVLDGVSQLSIRSDRGDWEIYFYGISCVYVNHSVKVLSGTDQSLDDFVTHIEHWNDWESRYGTPGDRRRKMKMEQAYWAYLRNHTNHYGIPDDVVDEALEQLGTSYNIALFEWNQPIFVPRQQAALWIEMITAIRDLPDKRLRVYLVASAMHDYSEYCELKDLGPVKDNSPNLIRTFFRFMIVWIFGFVATTLAIALLRPHRRSS
ncbi:hypothetical protein FRC12_016117 [Ceratobasidium sp. 428]|nr:hypothetical protein FRC09_009152 [Ceratobasidium sp. 395]KAG8786905.1 hypothetical protein FRC12_016117 [Ceratobasidium sp. 428]